MKKALTLLCCLLSTQLFAQTIPNAGFETWASPNGYEDPQGWGTYNFMSLFGNPLTATKTTDRHSGTYAIRMESKLVVNNPNPAIYPDTIHTIYSGTVSLPPVFGFPYTNRPDELQLFYKCTPVNNSTAGVLAYLLKWNSTFHRRDTIAKAASFIPSASTYTQLNVPLIYYSSLSPDTAVIFMSPIAVNTPHQIGSVLFADDLQFVTGTDIQKATIHSVSLQAIGNASYIIQGLKEPAQLTIYSLEGKKVRSQMVNPDQTILIDLKTGIFSYSISSEGKIHTGKLNISGN